MVVRRNVCPHCGHDIFGKPFRPGEKIEKNLGHGTVIRYAVADPPYTTRGKLRLYTGSGTIMTTWWSRDQLPGGYKVVCS